MAVMSTTANRPPARHSGRSLVYVTLTTITFDMDHTNKPRALPEGAFCGAGIEQLCLPSDFHNIGPRACENCKSLVEVNLMSTEITALLSSTFAHCVALNWDMAPATGRLRQRSSNAMVPKNLHLGATTTSFCSGCASPPSSSSWSSSWPPSCG